MTELTPEKIATLRELAKGATPGPRIATMLRDGAEIFLDSSAGGMRAGMCLDSSGMRTTIFRDRLCSLNFQVGCRGNADIAQRRCDARFIAALDPETVLALLERIGDLERGLNLYRAKQAVNNEHLWDGSAHIHAVRAIEEWERKYGAQFPSKFPGGWSEGRWRSQGELSVDAEPQSIK